MLKRSLSSTELQARVKCVLVGDGAVGKTSLIVSYTSNGFPMEYLPTAYDNYSVLVTVNEEPIQLQLCDTAGQDDFDLLRPLCYPHSDVFLLCFSIVNPTSFHNISEKWIPEIRSHCLATPIILVGTQLDLRNDVKVLLDLGNYGERPVAETDGRSKARRIGAVAYIECSALTQKNMKEVFDLAISTVLRQRSQSLPGSPKHRTGARKGAKRLNSSPPPLAKHEAETASLQKRFKRLFCCFFCQ